MFDALYDGLKGLVEDVPTLLNKGLEDLDVAKVISAVADTEDPAGAIETVKSQELPIGGAVARDTEKVKSVDYSAIERDWILRLKEFAKVE